MPHVMTLKEALLTEGPVFCEFRYGVEPQYFEKEDLFRWLSQRRTYGETWRCWSEKPTEEQRLMVKWESITSEKEDPEYINSIISAKEFLNDLANAVYKEREANNDRPES